MSSVNTYKFLFRFVLSLHLINIELQFVFKMSAFGFDTSLKTCNNNLRVSNIRVSNRNLIYNVCPKSALTWPSRHSRHKHLCRFYRSRINR